MADDAAYVRNINGVEMAPAGDSFVYFVPRETVDAYFDETLSEALSDGTADVFLDNLDLRNIAVGRLIDIARIAETVLASEAGAAEMHSLAAAIEDAGFVHKGIYTSIYPEAAEEDKA
jgi:hypothetical protein